MCVSVFPSRFPFCPISSWICKIFRNKLKPWCSFTLRTLLGISLQNQSSVKSLNDFSPRWHLIAALKDPTGRLPNWVFFWLMTQSHKQNEVYILFLQLKVLPFHIDQIANIHWITEKEREVQKNIYSALLTMPNLWLCGSWQTGRFLKRWEYQTTWPASCTQIKKQ